MQDFANVGTEVFNSMVVRIGSSGPATAVAVRSEHRRIVLHSALDGALHLIDHPVDFNLDTGNPVLLGIMSADCSDLFAWDSDGVSSLPIWMPPEECGQDGARITVLVPSSSRTFYLSYGTQETNPLLHAPSVFTLSATAASPDAGWTFTSLLDSEVQHDTVPWRFLGDRMYYMMPRGDAAMVVGDGLKVEARWSALSRPWRHVVYLSSTDNAILLPDTTVHRGLVSLTWGWDGKVAITGSDDSGVSFRTNSTCAAISCGRNSEVSAEATCLPPFVNITIIGQDIEVAIEGCEALALSGPNTVLAAEDEFWAQDDHEGSAFALPLFGDLRPFSKFYLYAGAFADTSDEAYIEGDWGAAFEWLTARPLLPPAWNASAVTVDEDVGGPFWRLDFMTGPRDALEAALPVSVSLNGQTGPDQVRRSKAIHCSDVRAIQHASAP